MQLLAKNFLPSHIRWFYCTTNWGFYLQSMIDAPSDFFLPVPTSLPFFCRLPRLLWALSKLWFHQECLIPGTYKLHLKGRSLIWAEIFYPSAQGTVTSEAKGRKKSLQAGERTQGAATKVSMPLTFLCLCSCSSLAWSAHPGLGTMYQGIHCWKSSAGTNVSWQPLATLTAWINLYESLVRELSAGFLTLPCWGQRREM